MEALTAEHIKQLVDRFYGNVKEDEILGPVFNDVAHVNWDEHLPRLYQFWNSIMLGTREYRGNAFAKHIELNQKIPLTKEHFTRWLTLFVNEAERCLPPDAAKAIIMRARQIASVIQEGIKRVGGKKTEDVSSAPGE
ncbi:MAG: group III truncated hemoglobin [Legionellales bacterium]|nr:group III truncated hemoglobin [Legionellales bacterium]